MRKILFLFLLNISCLTAEEKFCQKVCEDKFKPYCKLGESVISKVKKLEGAKIKCFCYTYSEGVM